MIPWVHPSPQPKLHLDWFNRLMHSLHQSVIRHVRACPSPQNCPFLWGSGPPFNTWFLGCTWFIVPSSISINSAVFAQLTADSPCIYNGLSLLSKLPLPMGDLDSHLIHGSLGPTESSTQMSHFAGFISDRQTDIQRLTERPHYLVCNSRLHLYM